MTLKSYLWGIKIVALLSLAALALVIRQIDPEKTGIVGQLFFYISLVLFLSSLFILLFTWMRRKIGGNDELFFTYLSVSFRQGILVALLISGYLILQQNRVFAWWDGALTVVGILLVELYFLTRK